MNLLRNAVVLEDEVVTLEAVDDAAVVLLDQRGHEHFLRGDAECRLALRAGPGNRRLGGGHLLLRGGRLLRIYVWCGNRGRNGADQDQKAMVHSWIGSRFDDTHWVLDGGTERSVAETAETSGLAVIRPEIHRQPVDRVENRRLNRHCTAVLYFWCSLHSSL